MRITIACGLYSRSWAGFWKNYRAAVRAVRTIEYNNLLLDYGIKQVYRGTKISSFSFRKIECDVGMYNHFHDQYDNSCYRSMAMQVQYCGVKPSVEYYNISWCI